MKDFMEEYLGEGDFLEGLCEAVFIAKLEEIGIDEADAVYQGFV